MPTTTIDQQRLEAIKKEELSRLEEKTPNSYRLIRRAVEKMPLGVPSSVFSMGPYPLTIVSGQGATITDADGHEYIDYGAGYGTMVFGHNHPEIRAALEARLAQGVFFGALGEDVTVWAELLSERFNLDWVRFSNSGTEAVMDALRLAQGLTGREKVVKLEGAYDGNSPWTLFSVHPDPDQIDLEEHGALTPVPLGQGLAAVNNISVVALNDLAGLEEVLSAADIAAVLIEPILFNSGALFPDDTFLPGVRELCDRYGTLLLFDEVKTGISIAYGGAEEYFGVQPDLKAFGKGIGGGVACGAFGGAADPGYDAIAQYQVPHFGTFSGNHLAAAAGRAACQLMDRQAYITLEEHRQYLSQGLEAAIEQYDIPAYVTGVAAKNCVVWAEPPALHNFRDYLQRLDEQAAATMWLWMINRGLWLTPGRDEQTTHSIVHTPEHADQYIAAFTEYLAALRA